MRPAGWSGRAADPGYIRKTPNVVSGTGAFAAADETEREHAARVARVDDPVVPEARGRVVRRPLALVRRADLVGIRVADHRQHRRRLVAAHHADPRVRPHPELTRLVGAAAHRVVPRAERAAGDDGELRHVGARDRHHELRAVAGDPALLVLAADHEPRDVLEEDERDPPLACELDEVRALLGRLGEQDPAVREDPDRDGPRSGRTRRRACRRRGP